MSGTQPEDVSPPCRNWTSSPELNETREPFLNPSADYDDEEFLRYLWKEYLHPKEYEWALIAGYIVVFIVALVGNVLAEVYPKMYHTCFFLVTYMAPLCLMVLAYLQIFRKLWCRQIPGTSSVVQKKWKSLQSSAQQRGLGQSTKSKISAVAAEIKQIRARRKTARMLMVVLLVFALCYLPISILNILKREV